MAKLPQFAVLYDNDVDKLQAVIDAGHLEYPAYIFNDETSELMAIKKDGTVTNIMGANKQQVMKVDILPDPADGDEEVLYIYKGAVYIFDAENSVFKPEYSDLSLKVNILVSDNEKNKTQISENKENIEVILDKLDDLPIKELVGTLDNPLVLSSLETGMYSIVGQYTIDDLLSTVFLSTSPSLFIIANNSDTVEIKKISNREIVDYVISNGEITTESILTSEYLKENGYITERWFDEKMVVLASEISNSVLEEVSNGLDAKIDTRISELFTYATESEINLLFT